MKFLSMLRKELLVLTRDRMAVVMILIAPLVMTTVMKLAFGNMNNGTDIPPIPVAVVNMDDGQIGQALVDLLKSDALDNLVDVTEAGDLEHAQSLLDDRTVDAVITTPPGLTDAIFSGAGSEATITIYGDPGRPFTAGIVRGIVQRFTQHVAAGSASVKVTFLQLIETRRVSEVTHTMKAELGERAAFMALESDLIQYLSLIHISEPTRPY